jgi:hypothetical protein
VNLLALGFFFLLWAIRAVAREKGAGLSAVIRHGALAFIGMAAVYVPLWLFAAYDPMATLVRAAELEAEGHWQPESGYLHCVATDLLEFALGLGWIPVGAAAAYFWRAVRLRHFQPPFVPALFLALQIAVVAFSYLAPVETIRLWMFLYPFVALPAGELLGATNRPSRLVTYVALWAITAAVAENMLWVGCC